MAQVEPAIDLHDYRQVAEDSQLGSRDTLFAQRDMEFSINAKLDLSQYMPLTPTGQKPYLILKAYGDWSKSRVTGEQADNRLDPAVMLVSGTKF